MLPSKLDYNKFEPGVLFAIEANQLSNINPSAAEN